MLRHGSGLSCHSMVHQMAWLGSARQSAAPTIRYSSQCATVCYGLEWSATPQTVRHIMSRVKSWPKMAHFSVINVIICDR